MAVSAAPATTTTPNDSGIVLILFCMMAALAHAVVSAVSHYAAAAAAHHKRVKLLSGWANVGNACVHVFLVLLLIVDQGGNSMFVSMHCLTLRCHFENSAWQSR